MFTMGDTDEYPQWALPFLTARMLWQSYGIQVSSYDMNFLLGALRLHSLENQREKNTRTK